MLPSVCLFAAAHNQRDIGRRGSTELFKENLASTASNVKHDYEVAIRKHNKMIGKFRKKLFLFGHLKKEGFYCFCFAFISAYNNI